MQPPTTSPTRTHGTDDALLVLDSDGRVEFATAAVERVFGAAPIQRGSDISAQLRFSDGDALHFDHSSERVEARLGSEGAWLELSVYPVPPDAPDVRPGNSIVVVRDVTARRRAGDLREAFAGVVSHELRTPVTTIYGGAQLLADESVSDATRTEAAKAIVQEAERLYRLIDDLVVLARYDQQLAIGDEPVLLQRFVPAIVADEQRRAATKITLTLDDALPAVLGRQGYIEQVLRHLLGSAVRFSPRNRDVTVSADRRGEEVELTVTDAGPDIDASEASQVFNLFHRSARTLSDASGANMSLFVCRRLVDAMGGRIWARPRPRGGAEMGFALRVAELQD